jgi:4,5-DOPA dioxygenase extradiol
MTTTTAFSSLQPSARMPVLFLGHGSPMNVITDNIFRQTWLEMGNQIIEKYGKPQVILCVSAHWLTRGTWLTAMHKPKTIHDFGGFPQELFDQQYPAPGMPEFAAQLSAAIEEPHIGLDDGEWGLDHGSWGVLKPMFPAADIPVVQLSMDYPQPIATHYAIGQQLRALRDLGVLIVGSGNVVHNLRVMRFNPRDPNLAGEGYDWAVDFDQRIGKAIDTGDHQALIDFQKLGALATQAHPTYDHYLPLLYTAGAAHAGESVRQFNVAFQGASISMRSVVWG